MGGYKCADCGSTKINDADCEDCGGSQEDADGNLCETCDGDGYMAGVMECAECGIVDDECAFEDVDDG